MIIKKWLNESFMTYVHSKYTSSLEPIYKNPDGSELADLVKDSNDKVPYHFARYKYHIRFIVDNNTKAIYCAPYYTLHSDMAAAANIKYEPNSANQFHGIAKRVGSKLEFVDSDTEKAAYYRAVSIIVKKIEADWSFADKYFTQPVVNILKGIFPKISKRDK